MAQMRSQWLGLRWRRKAGLRGEAGTPRSLSAELPLTWKERRLPGLGLRGVVAGVTPARAPGGVVAAAGHGTL